jgi:short-subunit dehydrogenase
MTGSAATLITGASGGIGAALARRLAADRETLVLVGRDRDRLQAVADDCQCLGASCEVVSVDLCDTGAVAANMAQLRRRYWIRRLVCSAGILDGRHEGEAYESASAARTVLATNLLATVDLVNQVLPDMAERRGGQIALISSLAGLAPLSDAPSYSASKAGLIAYGLGLREAVGPLGIRVVVVCPGYVETAMTHRHRGAHPGKIDATAAAARIAGALDRGRGLSGFPMTLYWGSRLALLAPEWIRRLATRGLRFHVA